MTNYRRGYLIERKAFAELTKQGYTCIRSSGSHTTIDLVAFPSKASPCHFIKVLQLKRTKKRGSYNADRKLLRNLNILYSPLFISKELWIWTDRKGWKKEVII